MQEAFGCWRTAGKGDHVTNEVGCLIGWLAQFGGCEEVITEPLSQITCLK